MTKAVRNTLLVCTGALAVIGLESGFSFHNSPSNASRVHIHHVMRPSNDTSNIHQTVRHTLNGSQNIYSQPDPTSYLVAQKSMTRGRNVRVVSRTRTKGNIYDEIQTITGLKGWVKSSGVSTKVHKIRRTPTSKRDLINLHNSQANLIKLSAFANLYNNGFSNSHLMLKASDNFLEQAVSDNHKIKKPSLRAYGQREIDNAKRTLDIIQEQRQSHLSTSDMHRTSQIGHQLNIAEHNLSFTKSESNQQKVNQLNIALRALNSANRVNSRTRNKTAKTLNTKMINNMIRYYDTVNSSLHTSRHLIGERDTALLSNARQSVHTAKVNLRNIMRVKNNKPSLNNVKHMINQTNNDVRIAQVATNLIQSHGQNHQAVKALNSIVNV